jgi:transcriptional regulator with XRE-family HTH domain
MKQNLPPGRRGGRRADERDAKIGNRIRALRLKREKSQVALAEQIGVSFQQVQKYEKGANRVGASRLQQIADALGVRPEFFFGERKDAAKSERKSESVFGYLRSRRVMRLLKAYDRIKKRNIRMSLITLAEHLAERAES